MKTQKFTVEITDLTGQFPVSEYQITKILTNNLFSSQKINVWEEKQ